MFVGREEELKVLDKLYKKETFQFAVIYGRRRVGKTTLIDHFIEEKDVIYFSAQEANDAMNLELFSRQILDFFQVPADTISFQGWKGAFSYIAERAQERQFVLVIDEYPYAAQANRSLNSILQTCIDHELKESRLFLILCGSQISFMENEVMGYKSPLFGRRTTQLKISGFDYLDAAEMLTGYSSEDKIKIYSCLGGTPHYLNQVDVDFSFMENIEELFFHVGGFLYDEPQMLLQQELREPAVYNTIITAIANGASRLSEIATKTDMDSRKALTYITTLMNLRLVHREYPFGENPAKNRKSIYSISDNCYRFWYRYVFPFRGAIERGAGKALAAEMVFPELSTFIGKPAFEEICMQYLVRLNQAGKLPFLATDFGTWWGNDPQEKRQADMDLVLHSKAGEEVILGECKWRNDLKDVQQINKLLSKSYLLPGYKQYYYYFFSKMPFSGEAREMEKQRGDLRLIELEDLFAI